MNYDVIIIGAGASGLFCGANAQVSLGLILDQSKTTGLKLLMSGGGQCNLTRLGNIKDFLSEYGENGSKIRTILYKFNNLKTMEFFETNGVPLFARDDLKVFPKSLKAADIKDLLIKKCNENNFEIKTNISVTQIKPIDNGFIINDKFTCQKLVIGTGGASYPTTGSDGKIFKVLEDLGLKILPLKAALCPIFVQDYDFADLAGLSFQSCLVSIKNKETLIAREPGDILLTHTGLSGPLILKLSRYAETGQTLIIDLLPNQKEPLNCHGVSKGIGNYIYEKTGLPKRFITKLLKSLNCEEGAKASTLPQSLIKKIHNEIHNMTLSISGTGGFKEAMVTRGGVALDEISPKTMESKKHPGLHLIGEVLDVDGNTGGYNLQFAFASGYIAAQHISL